MQLNKAPSSIFTHEGGKAKHINVEQQLRRSVMSCLLWEDSFYENGESISARIEALIPQVDALKVVEIAKEAKHKMKLRHVPLFIAVNMLKHATHKKYVAELLPELITRADELSEVYAMYWSKGRTPIAAQLKKGMAKAWLKFDEYSLAKYNRDKAIKLRDSLFLSHPKPKDDAQKDLWKRLIDGTLKTPDTWEVAISATKDKKAEWERLITEGKLGGLAYLRNLRNMDEAHVPRNIIVDGLAKANFSKMLPFNFFAAAKAVPFLESEIEKYMLKAVSGLPMLNGCTLVLVDVSGSMSSSMSKYSLLNRMGAACCLASLLRELCQEVYIFSFSDDLKIIPDRRGFALIDAIKTSQPNSSTNLGLALRTLTNLNKGAVDGRLVVITDEQSADLVHTPIRNKYLINVASEKNGVGYYDWTHIDGFSENVVSFIAEKESR
jgi:hypothetical protein